MTYTIESFETKTLAFGPMAVEREAFVAELAHETGLKLTVSRFKLEVSWIIDSLISPKGEVLIDNGIGDRTGKTAGLRPHLPIVSELNQFAHEAHS